MNPKISYSSDDDAAEFDELVARNVTSLHLEMLDDNMLWIGFEVEGKSYMINISARGKLKVKVEEE